MKKILLLLLISIIPGYGNGKPERFEIDYKKAIITMESQGEISEKNYGEKRTLAGILVQGESKTGEEYIALKVKKNTYQLAGIKFEEFPTGKRAIIEAIIMEPHTRYHYTPILLLCENKKVEP